jgi:DNA-binding CsgD family transcriptional regulator
MPGSKSVVWQVVATQDRVRRRVESYLEEGGYPVLRNGRCPLDIRLATVRAVSEITDAEMAVLEAMLVCDSAQEIADHLHIGRDAVYSHWKSLMSSFQVASRHRVILKAIRAGVLEVDAGGRVRRPRNTRRNNHDPSKTE